MSASGESPDLDLAALVADPATRVIVTCGSGGVGKTTTAAAIALLAAEAGRRTVVLTIDPALRLAQSLGLTELDNTPREVVGVDTSSGGRLFAMMLDMKRTFDDVVTAHATPERAQAIFDNPFYQSLSSSFAGTQEYMAMEKLSQLRLSDEWDLVVVDTPPSRSALDFLDAPQRLGRFLDGRMIRLLSAPARAGGKAYLKVVGASFSIFSRLLDRILGGELLRDVSSFVSALETMFGGFRERAQQTYELLKAPGTAFVVVAVPETAALREASYFVARLAADDMPLAGIVINRVAQQSAPGLSATRAAAAAEDIDSALPDPVDAAIAVAALRVHVETAAVVEAQSRLIRRLRIAHPGVATHSVPAMATDVHDLDGLREIGSALQV
ncbi:MAG: putative anion-transporting ATPase [Pseudonocardiales bacterium]|nr:putative anion-transporting ATPase [Pseudonocardiales bacterium]